MEPAQITLTPNSLWEKVKQQTQHAINCKSLKPIPTDYEFIQAGEINFLVRIVTNLARKDHAKKQQKKKQKKSGKSFNPFLPYEEDLFVADISKTHLCLLNKFNVVDYHLLIVTREFEEQESLLNLNDFAALWASLLQINGLGFYNSGKLAGASQPHKHLQLIPFPLAQEISTVPIDPLIQTIHYQETVGKLPHFDFVHGIIKFNFDDEQDPLKLAQQTLRDYYRLLEAVNINPQSDQIPEPYNLLVTREWMLMIPRSQAKFASISVNSLGFAGALLVKNEEQMETLKSLSPLTILTNVAQQDNQS